MQHKHWKAELRLTGQQKQEAGRRVNVHTTLKMNALQKKGAGGRGQGACCVGLAHPSAARFDGGAGQPALQRIIALVWLAAQRHAAPPPHAARQQHHGGGRRAQHRRTRRNPARRTALVVHQINVLEAVNEPPRCVCLHRAPLPPCTVPATIGKTRATRQYPRPLPAAPDEQRVGPAAVGRPPGREIGAALSWDLRA